MKLSYVTHYDALDVRNWSGTGYYIMQALKKQNVDFEYVGNLKTKISLFSRIQRKLYTSYTNLGFLNDRDFSVIKNYAKEIKNRISKDTDIVFSPSSLPIAMLKVPQKIVFYTDATFASLVDYYDYLSNLGKYALKQGHTLEKLALDNCDLAIYTSDWAAESAIRDYGTNPDKIRVVPRGANIESSRSEEDIRALVQKKDRKKCNLLFIGVEWKRKGGDIAVKIAETISSKGIPVQLDIVGVKEDMALPPFATNHGFISKSSEVGRQKLDALMSNAHFLLLPTRAECSAIVYCEASSWGLPNITTKTGGITTAVKDGLNGMTFDLSASPEEYSEYIIRLFSNFDEYLKLSLSSFHEYETRLNWEVAGKKIIEYCNEIIDHHH